MLGGGALGGVRGGLGDDDAGGGGGGEGSDHSFARLPHCSAPVQTPPLPSPQQHRRAHSGQAPGCGPLDLEKNGGNERMSRSLGQAESMRIWPTLYNLAASNLVAVHVELGS